MGEWYVEEREDVVGGGVDENDCDVLLYVFVYELSDDFGIVFVGGCVCCCELMLDVDIEKFVFGGFRRLFVRSIR